MATKIITKTDHFASNCAVCGRTLTNPGYGKQSRECCGKYRRWYDTREITFQVDDGRDERGRFHHKPTSQRLNTEIIIQGGV